ncbi:solute:Na+ symporter, SSS family [Dethiosulfatibacter aminovorans DSM 17477]|uniref:Solute:Na+ symporter, SSS family n=1 Tax=Dethiosulfatibacter aminovorans DSM 17477 TaxID=1121476 RepID=A0A1M6N3G2_9FIRM|nr:sodium:solute symporter family protein [Dethiosulfatibacter aminovorans]SHJ90207.1 solute:Na+ symporter, SSS family [Dethiosulfatibacter aminovorans DSM 17477]
MNQSMAVLLATTLILVATFFATSFINNRQKKKVVGNASEDWDVGGRSLPLYVVIGTQFATAMGGGILVGQVGNGYQNGYSVFLYGILCQLAFIILMFIADWLRDNNFATIPEILQHFSGPNKTVKILAGILTIIVPFGWICGQLSAFGKLYSTLTGFSPTILTITLAVASLFFVMPSGLKTVAWTDFIFGILMVIFASAVCFHTLSLAGGMENVLANVPPEIVQFPSSIFSVGLYTSVLWVFSLVPGGLTNQMYYQRIFACKELKEVKKSLWITALVCIIAYFWAVTVGLSVRSINPGLGADREMATGWLLTQLPTWLVAIFSGLIIAAILSTVSSGVQSIVVNLNRDIYRTLHPDCDSSKVLKISKFLSVIVIATAVVLSLAFPSVIKMIVTSYSFSAAGLLCPIFVSYAFRNKNFITKNAILAGMIVGIIACMVSMLFNTSIPYVIWGIIPSGISMVVVSKIEQKEDEINRIAK